MVKKLLLCLVLLTFTASFVWANGKQPAKKEKSVVPPLEELIELKENQEILYPEPLDGRQIDTLIYDDGSPSDYYHWTGAPGPRMAQRMTPAQPCKILTIQYYCYSSAGTATFDAAIYDWTGSMPGAQLGTLVPVQMDGTHQWYNADSDSNSCLGFSGREHYFAGRGLLYTYRGGKRVDTSHLHIKEWIDCIRNGTQPSCNIDQGFEEAITAHMGTIAYREKREVFWDADKQEII